MGRKSSHTFKAQSSEIFHEWYAVINQSYRATRKPAVKIETTEAKITAPYSAVSDTEGNSPCKTSTISFSPSLSSVTEFLKKEPPPQEKEKEKEAEKEKEQENKKEEEKEKEHENKKEEEKENVSLTNKKEKESDAESKHPELISCLEKPGSELFSISEAGEQIIENEECEHEVNDNARSDIMHVLEKLLVFLFWCYILKSIAACL